MWTGEQSSAKKPTMETDTDNQPNQIKWNSAPIKEKRGILSGNKGLMILIKLNRKISNAGMKLMAVVMFLANKSF